MRRRSLLSSVVLLSGGCLGAAPDSSDSPDRLRDVTLAAVHDEGVPDQLEFDVSVDSSEITVDRTAEVIVSLTNDGDSPWVVRHGSYPPFDPTGSEDAAWQLAQPDKDITKRSERCWTPEDVRKFGIEMAYTYLEYDPGQTRSTTLELWSYPVENGDCMPPGTFSFFDSSQLAEMDRSPVTEFDWGFEMEINRDQGSKS